MKKIFVVIYLIVIIGLVWFGTNGKRDVFEDYKTGIYMISGTEVKLGGEVKYFGNEVDFDLNGDGKVDKVFLIQKDTSFFVAGAIATKDGYKGTQAMLLGTNINPQSTNLLNGKVVVNFVKDSVGQSVWIKYDPKDMSFGELVQNFEGESNLPK